MSCRELEVERVLSDWTSCSNHWLYSVVLERLLWQGSTNEKLISIAVDYLISRNGTFSSTGEPHLAIAVGSLVLERKERQWYAACTDLLRTATSQEPKMLSCESYLEAFEMLVRLDRSQSDYWIEQHTKWAAIKLERDKLNRFQDMITNGNYWGILKVYLDIFKVYDLPFREMDHGLCKMLKENQPTPLGKLFATPSIWKLPLTTVVGKRRVVVEDFVLLGQAVFSLSLDADENVVTLRNRLNKTVEKEMTAFFDVLVDVEGLSAELRQMIATNRRNFSSAS